MADWGRDTAWRQGHFLRKETIETVGLDREAEYVVISHDCDLTQMPKSEPLVEVIVARCIERLDGNLTFGKNARRLHLTATVDGGSAFYEFTATEKQTVAKEKLAEHEPSDAIRLGPPERRILQLWLAARYSRSAFPDEFDRRLKDSKLTDDLRKILKPLADHIVAVFFDVDEGVDVERTDPDDVYTLAIDLLYSTATDPAKAEAAAKSAAESIDKAFKDRCFDGNTNAWKAIELLSCDYQSDEAMSYRMSRQLKRWNADHMSLRDEPPAPMLFE